MSLTKNTYKLFLAILLCVSASLRWTPIQAQPVQVKVRADSAAIFIGSPFHLDLTVTHTPGWEVQFPMLMGNIGSFDILDQTEIDSLSAENGDLQLHQQLTLTAFDSGYFDIPPIPVNYFRPGDTSVQTVSSNPIPMTVFVVPVDTTQDIRPIKEPLDAPVTFREVLPYLVLVGLIAAIAFGIWYGKRFFKKEPEEVQEARKPIIPPHILANQRLDALETEKLWQEGKFKSYYSELTNILREYLENRYHILALESTTDEIMRDLKEKDLPSEARHALDKLLTFADLVKFAKYTPVADDCQKAMHIARDFVAETKAEPVQEAANEPDTQGLKIAD